MLYGEQNSSLQTFMLDKPRHFCINSKWGNSKNQKVFFMRSRPRLIDWRTDSSCTPSASAIALMLVYCADCGSKMSYQTNYYKSGEPYHSFRCSSYGNRTVNCTIHHISDKVLYQLVLRSIQRLSSHIIADERGFAEELKSKWETQANGKPQKQKEELQTINRRLNELDRLIGSLYENFISGLLVQVPDEEILC